MPIQSRHFGVKANATAVNATGYTDHGILLVQNASGGAPAYGQAGTPPTISGTIWQIGPDEERQDFGSNPSIIAYTKAAINDDSEGDLNTEGTIGTASYEPGDGSDQSGYQFNGDSRKIAFKMCANEDFLAVAQDMVPAQNFTTETEAVTYFNTFAVSAWTNHNAAVATTTVTTTEEPVATNPPGGGENRDGEGGEGTNATSATTAATNATSAPYVYYNLTDCLDRNASILRYAGTSGLIHPGSTISLSNQSTPPKWPISEVVGKIGELSTVGAFNLTQNQFTIVDTVNAAICPE